MATNDYVIDNQTGANFRADINTVLSAIVSNNSNATEPTTTYAFMWWADTTAGILKQRNSSNSAWVKILDLTTGASVATGINDLTNAVSDDALGVIGIGFDVFSNLTTGHANAGFGYVALVDLITGWGNSGFGNSALRKATTGYENSGFGFGALFNLLDGYRNVAIGNDAGNNITNENNTITIGYGVASIGSNYFTMGKGVASDRVYNEFTANATWTRVSDQRVKKEIETNEDCGLGFINDLRTVIYKFKAPSELAPEMSEYDKDNDIPSHDKPMYGFIAQEVKRALDKHGIKNFAGHHQIKDGKDNLQGISYEMFVMPLVKAVQELSAKNQKLETKISDMLERLEALETNPVINMPSNRSAFDSGNIDTGV
jgi:hypothetical protein